MAAQNVRYAELTLTPYTSVLAGVPIEAFVEAVEDARVAAERDLGISAALDLRHPGRVRPAGGGGDRGVRARPRPGRADRLRARRAGDRRRPAAVQAGLRPGPGGRAAQRPARRGDDRAADDLGRARATSAPSASGTARPPSRTRALLAHLVEHRIPLEVCPTSNIATRAVDGLENHPIKQHVRRRRARHGQLRRPADVRHHAQPRVRDRRRPARARRRRGGRPAHERGDARRSSPSRRRPPSRGRSPST